MACYDEVPNRDQFPDEGSWRPGAGPRVQRDGMNVREIAENSCYFTGHNRPRRQVQRDADWNPPEE